MLPSSDAIPLVICSTMKIIRSEVPPLRSSGLGAMLDCPVVTAAFVVPQVAGQLLVTAGDTPSRMRSEAAFAMLCGVAPLPAPSGKTVRHRLNRGGDRQANRALHLAVPGRMRLDSKPRHTWRMEPLKDIRNSKSIAA